MKRYKVVGSEPVLGDHQPGDTFDANLNEDQEKFLIDVGAIKVVSNDPGSDKRFSENKAEESEGK